MAIKPYDRVAVGKELLPEEKRNYCKFTLHENGAPLTRRGHGMLVQAKNGQVFLIDGPDLPGSIDVFTGDVQGGRNLFQILLNPDAEEGFALRKSEGLKMSATPKAEWPISRTALVFAAGFIVHSMWSIQHELLMLFTQ